MRQFVTMIVQVIGFSIALLLSTVQAEGEPDLCRLSEIVARIVVDDETIGSGLTVVLVKKDLEELPPEVRSRVEERLNKASGGWEVLSEPIQRMKDLPGKWKRVKGLGRVNQTHVLVRLTLSGDGDTRKLEHGQTRGNLYGHGEEITLQWKDGGWHEIRVITKDS